LKLAIAILAALTLAGQAAAADVYLSDPPHTMAHFETAHLGISWVRGRFSAVDAKIMLDRAARQGSIEAVIKTASVDTGHEARDKHVRSEDYLDVEKFPTMTFKSNKLNFDGDRLVSADGELTLMGVNRPVTLEIPYFRCIQHPANKREMCGADVRTMIKRSEFGAKRGVSTPITDEVKIAIQIEAYKQ
jgi:polyisoprenoid-binding protein YceI